MTEDDSFIQRLMRAFRTEARTVEPPALEALISDLENFDRGPSLADLIVEPEWATELPCDFGPFRLQSHVGSGGTGEVYEAIERESGQQFAIKLLRPSLIGRQAAEQRFERESKLIAKLNHPAIVKIHSTGVVEDTPYISMEFIDGVTMSQLTRGRRESDQQVDPAEACGWIVQAAEAMQHAHDEGVLHRDIKPANLMLDDEGNVRVLDLGLAKLVRQNPMGEAQLLVSVNTNISLDGQILGTPEFMAPEQVNRQDAVDQRADVFGLAATLHYLLTGRSMYVSDSKELFGRAIATVSEPSIRVDEVRDDISEALADLIDRALAKDPTQRPQTLAAFAREIRSCLQTGVARPNLGWWQRKRSGSRIRLAAIVSGVVMTLAVGFWLSGGLAGDRPADPATAVAARSSDSPMLISPSPKLAGKMAATPKARHTQNPPRLGSIKNNPTIALTKTRGLLQRPRRYPGMPDWQLQPVSTAVFTHTVRNLASADLDNQGQRLAYTANGIGYVRELTTGRYLQFVDSTSSEGLNSVIWRGSADEGNASRTSRAVSDQVVWCPRDPTKGEILVTMPTGERVRDISLKNLPSELHGPIQIAPVGDADQFIVFGERKEKGTQLIDLNLHEPTTDLVSRGTLMGTFHDLIHLHR